MPAFGGATDPAAGNAVWGICASGMFGLGLLDDFVTLKPYAKLVGQIVFATALSVFGLRLNWFQASAVLDQALARSGPRNNKGAEAAETAIEMANLIRRLQDRES